MRISGEEFAAILDAGEVHERVVESGAPVLLVEGDGLPDRLGGRSMDSLATLAAVVVAVLSDSHRRPEWADLVVGPLSRDLEATLETVRQNPMAAVTFAVLLRGGSSRSVTEGIVAESVAYGLLQGGPEFAQWRAGRPARVRPEEHSPAVLVSRSGDDLSITLDRPHVLNAFNAGMRDELIAALRVAALDPTIATVRLRGSGDSFCSGGDLEEFGSRPDPASAHLVRLQRNAAREMATVAGKTTAYIHGSTVGSGIELAAFAHRVVADPNTVVSLPEVRLGLIPGAGGTVSLPRRIGRHATLLLALGRPSIDAGTALEWGLVDEIGPVAGRSSAGDRSVTGQ
jgi:enoyl-CoA hydratase/carnithine racemase